MIHEIGKKANLTSLTCYYHPMGRAGFVLVGGHSSRMGRDKALLPYQGRTLVEYVAAQVLGAAGSVALAGAPERYGFLGFPMIGDLTPGFGPVAGIQAALASTSADWNLIVACDMPSLSADFLRSLFVAAEHCGEDCLIPYAPPAGRRPVSTGLPQPLCAVYHRDCLPAIERAIRENLRKATDAVSRLSVCAWPVADNSWFQNLNTPEDLAIHV